MGDKIRHTYPDDWDGANRLVDGTLAQQIAHGFTVHHCIQSRLKLDVIFIPTTTWTRAAHEWGGWGRGYVMQMQCRALDSISQRNHSQGSVET